MRLTTLFSGSHGNCTLVQHKGTNVLVDAGFSHSTIKTALQPLGLCPTDVDAILITHEHSDHVSALARWTEHYETPIYAHQKLLTCLPTRFPCGNYSFFTNSFQVGNLQVDFAACSHDALSCTAYRFFDGKDYAAICTDTGVAGKQLIDFLLPAKNVVVESNYDQGMLELGDYPPWLKQRIASNKGHLSNEQCGKLVEKLLKHGVVRNVVLGHLSQNNNTKELAFANALGIFQQNNVLEGKDVGLYVADQYSRGITLD
ncbi:MAG: MBL fold metallo-hydrolase [Clostridia bacterium]|nr:MBL fold metallo-hydrolase [Clostridia bacterium]